MDIVGILMLAMLIIFVFLLFYFVPVGMWIQGVVSLGLGRITIIDLIRMRLRKISPRLIVDGVINTHKAGLVSIKTDMLETHYLAGGNVVNVVFALIASDKANIPLTFETATAIDLAGRDVKTAVETSVYPKVIDAPREGFLSAVAKDGIELKARARVTVRTNIPGLVGGATDDTIIARVGEGIVSAIGSSTNYGGVLENPDNISRAVLEKGLDAGTAFEILSIDIADLDVGKNVGAQLQADQAEADLRVAQARAETRRAMAVAEEQEMKARTQEMQAKVVASEAEVPLAMAQAFREGKLGVFDYVNMRNIQADTDMRESISGGSESSSTKAPERDKH
ncbi:MAG: flotillin-like protein FloA [Candidatus Marinimicrobia bacterium]|nr:flotillin-like protein FloA [Candidatus Neomarinimicrobiota bacterium]